MAKKKNDVQAAPTQPETQPEQKPDAKPEVKAKAKAKKKSSKPKPKPKAAKAVAPKAQKSADKAQSVKTYAPKKSDKKAVQPKAEKAKAAKPKAKKTAKAGKSKKAAPAAAEPVAQLVSSETVFEGKLFRVLRDQLIEPGGHEATRDVIRHNGSVVILALDSSKNKRDPWVVLERQYRHAAGRYLWELPAGKLDPGEDALAGAQRELEEETGYHAKKWKLLVEYFASPGFLGESMKVFLAEGLVVGVAHPEEDERIELRLVKLSELVKLIEKGAILDGKTLTSVLLYARQLGRKGGK